MFYSLLILVEHEEGIKRGPLMSDKLQLVAFKADDKLKFIG